MHQHLGDLGAMRLVGLPDRVKLGRADDAAAVTRNEELDAASGDLHRNATPEALEIGRCVPVHEANRGAVRHGIAQDLRQGRHSGLRCIPIELLDDHHVRHRHDPSPRTANQRHNPLCKINSNIMDEVRARSLQLAVNPDFTTFGEFRSPLPKSAR
ncbi:hypothetical protein BOSE62_110229 [Bosea sp. 62]|nr:hypothetical protein BOSE62_110229 [Bosea sp. 62]